MICRICLNDPTVTVVADASVAINIIATGYSDIILRALPNHFTIVEQVMFELESGKCNGHSDFDVLNALVSAGKVEVVRLGTCGLEHFTAFVSGSAAQTLDDGEAATIAYALENNVTPLIDERKAKRLCAKRFTNLFVGCSVDLLAHAAIVATLDRVQLSDAVFSALYHGRMRVPACRIDWVIDLIGSDRARHCSSLPKSVRSI